MSQHDASEHTNGGGGAKAKRRPARRASLFVSPLKLGAAITSIVHQHHVAVRGAGAGGEAAGGAEETKRAQISTQAREQIETLLTRIIAHTTDELRDQMRASGCATVKPDHVELLARALLEPATAAALVATVRQRLAAYHATLATEADADAASD